METPSKMTHADCTFPVRWDVAPSGCIASIPELKLASVRAPSEVEAYEDLHMKLVNLLERARERAVVQVVRERRASAA